MRVCLILVTYGPEGCGHRSAFSIFSWFGRVSHAGDADLQLVLIVYGEIALIKGCGVSPRIRPASPEEYKKFQCSGLWLHEKVFVFSAVLGPTDAAQASVHRASPEFHTYST